MQSMTNNEIIELLMSLSEKFSCSSVSSLIDELEASEEFMKKA